MRLVKFEYKGKSEVGVRIDQRIVLLDSAQASTIAEVFAMPDFRSALTDWLGSVASLQTIPVSDVKLLPPVEATNRIFCVGLNYLEHVRETSGAERAPAVQKPAAPTIFLRLLSSFVGDSAPILRPVVSEKFDWEGELTAVIGRSGFRITEENALDHVAGYTIANDGSMRDWQLASTQWTLGKNFEKSGSIGPEIVTADELPPGARGLAISTRVNGETVQDDNTDNMMFDLPFLVSHISQAVRLEVGDLILTGTPSGVGVGRKPPRFLSAGDVCEVEVGRVGILRNPVQDEPSAK
ncbi:fumarylacetoacetate hydrolase family protein [Bradyrhizobium sp. SSUT18]|uniref:fumarylacetoacetate hydrolase family protein n=1 Tax=Bradyrhizobium sp. SSUT18 TaxID=3040602 RepID=UPI00244A7E1F|nr:fumarylacetoacetate hydrolase family protein [Bradyrhizobium sp. SSUT18]MDH2401826.1 fumarylacetoacetate hydrolase family protein [Bradyrhizobium sp. SSUT18]